MPVQQQKQQWWCAHVMFGALHTYKDEACSALLLGTTC